MSEKLTKKTKALPDFRNAKVQIVYRLLCDTSTLPPDGEHWEGFLARRIVAALSEQSP